MTSTPSLPAQIEAVRRAISKIEASHVFHALDRDGHPSEANTLRAVLVTLQQHERLEAVAEAARVYNRCRSVSNERLMRDALAALDTASTEIELELARRDTAENVTKF
jgi:histidyl-tRNA synthetase